MTPETPVAHAPTRPAGLTTSLAQPRAGMRARLVRAPRLRTSLARRFLLANLAILLTAGLIIGAWVGDQLERGIIDRTASITALYVESFIEPSLASMVDGGRLASAEVDQLDALLADTPLGERIVSLRVWAPDGTIVYSQLPELIGQRFPVQGHLAGAWDGRLEAEMSDLSGDENVAERARWDRLLEMYVPVRARGDDRIIAVAEFYQLPTEIDREVADARSWSWAIVAAAIAASAALLYGIVKQGSDTIASQEAALTRQVGELSELLRQNEALGERVRTAAERATTLNERSLRRISSDLHDGPGQTLSLALMRLDSLHGRAATGGPAPGAGELSEVEGALQDAMRDMRAIAAGLRMPELAPLSVGEVVDRAVGDHRRRTGTEVDLRPGPLPGSVPLPVKITLFRALQESLSNAARHGAGAPVRVTVEGVEGLLRLEVADAGPGFDPAALAEGTGLGLPGMREQAELLGGGFEVRSAPGQGTVVRAWWPLQPPRSGNSAPTAGGTVTA